MAAESNDAAAAAAAGAGFFGYQSGICTSSASTGMMIYHDHQQPLGVGVGMGMGMGVDMGMGIMSYFAGGGSGGGDAAAVASRSTGGCSSSNSGLSAGCSAVVGRGGGGGMMMLPMQSGMIPAGPGMLHLPPTTSSASASASAPSPAPPLLLDSVPGLNHDSALAVDWSPEEQYKLEQGLHKFTDEPSIMKYIKIAAYLRDKTVRDVALRCRWMTRKRRKADECHMGKKFNNRKDKLVEASSKMNMTSAMPQNMAVYPLMVHKMDQIEPVPVEGISSRVMQLLEQNVQAFSQITANLSGFKLQENIELFLRSRNNINAILNDMREMPGIMNQMPPLPVSINDDFVNSILPNTTQSVMFCSPTGVQLKQEPRC